MKPRFTNFPDNAILESMEEEAVFKPTPALEIEPEPSGFKKPVLGLVLILIAGVVTGYFLSLRQTGKAPLPSSQIGEKIAKGAVFGVDNPKVYRDTAEGVLEVNDGKFTDEGTHKLLREGGESQTAYLTSSNLDLNKFLGRKMKVWGETFTAQKAGWLMDIGKVEVLE